MTIEQVQRAAQYVAKVFSRRFSRADHSDLVQEATLAILQAQTTYNVSEGTPRAHAFRAAYYALRRYTWRTYSVVAPPRPERGGQRIQVKQLTINSLEMNLTAEDLAALAEGRGSELLAARRLSLQTAAVPMDEAIAEQQFRERARALLEQLDCSKKKLGIATALDETPPPVVAKKARVPLKKVYYARKNLMRQAVRSEELRQVWQEFKE